MTDVRRQIAIDRMAHGNDHGVIVRAIFPIAYLRAKKYEMICAPPDENLAGMPEAIVYEIRLVGDRYVICLAAVQNTMKKSVKRKTAHMISAGLAELAKRLKLDDNPQIEWRRIEETPDAPRGTMH